MADVTSDFIGFQIESNYKTSINRVLNKYIKTHETETFFYILAFAYQSYGQCIRLEGRWHLL